MYLLNLAQFWALVLCLQVCQHLPSGLEMFLCVSGASKKFGAWGLIEAEILTSPLPNVFAQLGLGLGADALLHGVSTSPKWSRNVPMCLRNLQKIWCMEP